MSRENVEIVRRVYEAAARRDSATVLALYDPEVELDNSRLGLAGFAGEGGVYDEQAGPRSRCPLRSSGRSARARSSGWSGSRLARRPSRSPDCPSRRAETKP